MADIELVIRIDEKLYNDICFDTEMMIYGGRYNGKTLLDSILRAIRNGTPLPKGHGKLIDVNDLLDRIGLEDNASNREDNVGEIITLEDFDFTLAIIEADEESEE